jgi:two-component system cell cycle sensor histidine kinase/response regulator CckA
MTERDQTAGLAGVDGQSEANLHQGEPKYPSLGEQTTSIVYVSALDEPRRKVCIAPKNEAMLGFSSAEWLADPMLWFKQLHPDDRERVLAEFYNGHDRSRPILSEYRLLARDSRVVWVHDEAVVVRNECGLPSSFMQGVMSDISESRQEEEALQKSEAKFRAIFERVAVGIALVGIKGRLMEGNPALQEMLGYSGEELRGRVFSDFTHADDAAEDTNHYKELVAGKRDHYQMEKRFIRKDGEVIWGLQNVSVVRGIENESPFIICMVENITEHKQLENHFLQSQKMETVGRLAGGIAHDFNNILTVIRGYSQLLVRELDKDHPLRENVDEIGRSTERAEILTRQLLALSRRQVMEMKVIDLNELLQNLEKMLCRLIGEDVELTTVLAEGIGRVKVDPGQIEQVILNLAVNARDAMPSGGKLALETENIEIDESYARSYVSVTPGRYVILSVSDTGVGMPPEVKDRIFEPFFTTKGKGKGTGLGLSTVYGIVKQSGGNIWVYSELGHGTTFKIYFPRVEGEAEPLTSKNETEQLPRGDETVLLVEDESSVRGLAARVLREQGYNVLEATDGNGAMNLAQEQKDEKIHLLLTDMVMPRMGGKELVKWMEVLHPGIRVLFISGYTEHAVAQHSVLKLGTPFLQKPFSPTSLAKKVREVLDKE